MVRRFDGGNTEWRCPDDGVTSGQRKQIVNYRLRTNEILVLIILLQFYEVTNNIKVWLILTSSSMRQLSR